MQSYGDFNLLLPNGTIMFNALNTPAAFDVLNITIPLGIKGLKTEKGQVLKFFVFASAFFTSGSKKSKSSFKNWYGLLCHDL